METVKIIFTNLRETFLLMGLLFLLMAIVGKIDTQWFTLDFSDLLQRGSLVLLGFLSIILGWFDKLRTGNNHASNTDRKLNRSNTFEWQWAAENWYGKVTLEKINDENIITQAKVGLIMKTLGNANLEPRILMDGMVLRLAPNSKSTFEFVEDGLDLDLSVQKKHRGTGVINLEHIKGRLNEVPCFAGRVTFSSNVGTYEGDIILVGYESQLGAHVKDWFNNEQEWFENYLMDK